MRHLSAASFRVATRATIFNLLVLLLCAGQLSAADTVAPKSPPPVAPELQVVDRYLLAIPKAGFGKDYQFTASLIPQEVAATSTGLAGKIVRFELFPDGVDMYESTQGLIVTEDLPARRLLATFAIIRQDGDKVVIDFNKGMRRVFTTAWTGGGGFDSTDRDRVLEVPESRVFEMRQDNDRVVIRQSVQVRNRQYDENLESRYEMRYFISPYKPGQFEGKEPTITDSRYTQFFETDSLLEPDTGRLSSRIVRFDLRHPVVFYYSANTPTNYIDAVKDGILYWNLVFGKEVVQVKKAPDGVTAPDAQYNIIQWVPWDNAGFAYADILLDPISGESEHGQAYITSVFAFGGRANARVLLRSMEEAAEAKKDGKDGKKNIAAFRRALPFLSANPVCEVDSQVFAQQMAHGLNEVLASDELTDAAVLRMSQDYVREVVAHEVGHVFGLRHNFAGSLAATMTHKDLDDWFKAYVTGQPLDAYTNKFTTSSIMEYTIFKAAAFVGWRIRTLKEPMPHDHAAIGWGYFDTTEAHDKKVLFGTDQDTFRYNDIRRFDYGPDPVISAYSETARIIDLLPNGIIETFIRARAPRNPRDRIPLEQVNLSYTGYASQLAFEFADLLSWFRADSRSLRVENQFDFIGDLNRKERLEAHWESLTNQIKQLGGVDRAVFSALPVDLKLEMKDSPTNVSVAAQLNASNLTARVEKLLESSNYVTFVGLDDKKYSFTKDEKALIVSRAKTFFEKLEPEFLKQVCLRLVDTKRDLHVEASGAVSEDDIVAKLEQRIVDLAKVVITTKDETNRIKGRIDKTFVEVVDYKYDQPTRLAAARMLGAGNGSFKGWADEAKGEISNQLKTDMEAALGIEHYKEFKFSMLSRSLHDWYQQQQEILAQLPQPPQPPAAGPAK